MSLGFPPLWFKNRTTITPRLSSRVLGPQDLPPGQNPLHQGPHALGRGIARPTVWATHEPGGGGDVYDGASSTLSHGRDR